MRLPDVVPPLSRTPGTIHSLGGALGEHNRAVYVDELGCSDDDLARWREEGAM